MNVYKFGGAYVKNAAGVRNLLDIVTGEKKLFIIVSAMGKTTNALEGVFTAMQQGDKELAMRLIDEIYTCHRTIINDLMGADVTIGRVDVFFEELRNIVLETIYHELQLYFNIQA
ncbi:MAG: hypothetical protein IJZ68_02540 [Bacteroidaceae bacterium]|nr:hypothetical protein [Bacteroidaceae bacterium]